MDVLQLKRTENKPDDVNYTPEEGEAVIALNASDYYTDDDPESNIGYMFIGNGLNTLAELKNSGNYIRLSKYQVPGKNFITSDMIQDHSITSDMLSFTVISKEDLNEYGEQLEKDVKNDIDIARSISKSHYAICYTESDNYKKECSISDFTDDNLVISAKDADGLRVVVKFMHDHTAIDSPMLTLKNSNNNIVAVENLYSSEPLYLENIPIMFRDEPIRAPYLWQAGDYVDLTYDYSNNSWKYTNTSALRVLGNWCYNNDTTIIDGGLIATGTITAEQIQAGAITADKIAVGSMTADKFESDVLKLFERANEAAKNALGNRTIVADCLTVSGEPIKLIELSPEDLEAINIMYASNNSQNSSVSLLVTFKFPNTYRGTDIQLGIRDTDGNTLDNKSIRVIEADGTTSGDLKTLNWLDENEIRLLTYTGNEWLVSLPTAATMAAAQWCKANNQTWIGGGSIVTGKISAVDIEANSITSDKIAAGAITSDKIAIGSLSADLFEENVLNNLRFYDTDGVWIGNSGSKDSDNIKIINIESEDESLINVLKEKLNSDEYSPIQLLVKFENENTKNSGLSIQLFGKVYDILSPSAPASNKSNNTDFLWKAGSVRLFRYVKGSGFEINIPSPSATEVAKYCLNNNQTYISGGSVITGSITADQICSGTIDAGTIRLASQYGGISDGQGSNGSVQTTGIKMYSPDMYGNVDQNSESCNYIITTTSGIRLQNNISAGADLASDNKSCRMYLADGNIQLDATNGISKIFLNGPTTPNTNGGIFINVPSHTTKPAKSHPVYAVETDYGWKLYIYKESTT